MTRVRRDGCLNQRRVDVVGARIDSTRHRRRAALAHGQPGGDVGVAGYDDFVSRTHVHGTQGEVQSVQAVGDTYCVGCAAVLGVVLFKLIDFGAANEPAGADNAGNGFVQLLFQFQVRGFQVKKRDHAASPLSISAAAPAPNSANQRATASSG